MEERPKEDLQDREEMTEDEAPEVEGHRKRFDVEEEEEGVGRKRLSPEEDDLDKGRKR